MMKKTTQNLLLAFSALLLLVSVSGGAQAQIRVNFSGTWKTVTDKGKTFGIILRHERSDPSVVTGSYGVSCLTGTHPCPTGSYKPLDGSINGFLNVSWRAEPVPQNMSWIKGTVTGNVLSFTWREDGGQGVGRFTISSDGESFEGTYSAPDGTSAGTWNGTRQHSFAGAWQGKLGETFIEVVFQQTGRQVAGYVNLNSAPLYLKEGIVDGNTLRFKLFRRNINPLAGRPDEYLGTGELVMNPGGKSFQGTILGAAASGTHVGR